ncbi:hypothetical protein LZ30DRAFT_57226 [Colletotrichum cereale]|nr:hypothetical protein LZ30DRAFT_57226 [Colletotrichum cereale]
MLAPMRWPSPETRGSISPHADEPPPLIPDRLCFSPWVSGGTCVDVMFRGLIRQLPVTTLT